MWEVKSKIIDDNIHKFSIYENQVQLNNEAVIDYWQKNSGFRSYYFTTLQKAPFEAFFWENPPITKSNLNQAYEFVLVNSPSLSRVNADSNPFQEKFNSESSGKSIIVFENLGRDAELIVPRPIASQSIYSHLATFIHDAPENQKHDLFVELANTLDRKVNINPIWVSTSGLGVYWLHIRLDTRPKYYSYQGYRQYNI